jgi:hypothetical protein
MLLLVLLFGLHFTGFGFEWSEEEAPPEVDHQRANLYPV